MARKNPTWVGRRIQAELRFLGCEVSPPSPSPNTCAGPSGPPSPAWRASLAAHRREIAAVDFFVVPTLAFRPLFGFVILRHDRRELLHIGVTDQPTATWAAQQIVHAFPDETGPTYLLPDRDAVYGADFQRRVERMGIRQVVIAPRAPWQNPFAQRVIGSIRRECLDSSSCSTNATRVACFARTSATTTLRGLTRVSVATAHAGARYSRSHPGVSSQSPRSAGFITATSARASSPLPARRLTARRPRLPVPLRSSVQAGLSWVDTVIWLTARVGVRVGSGANLLRACAKRFGWADHLFDRDKVSLWPLSENIRGRPLLSRATFRMAYKQHSSSVGPRSNTRTGLRQLESAP